jgi:hypothetical protein
VLSPPSLGQWKKRTSSEKGIKLRQEDLQATCCYGKALPANPRKSAHQGVGELGLDASSSS